MLFLSCTLYIKQFLHEDAENMLSHAKDLRHLSAECIHKHVYLYECIYAFGCVNIECQYKSNFERFSSVYPYSRQCCERIKIRIKAKHTHSRAHFCETVRESIHLTLIAGSQADK